MIKQYQLKDGSIRYSYIAYVGIDQLTGKEKRVKKSGFKTQKEARIAESQLLLKTENTKEKTAEKFAQFLGM